MNLPQAQQGQMIPQQDDLSPINRMKSLTSNGAVKDMFRNALDENAGVFIASLIDLYNDPSSGLYACDPTEVMMEALKAATLNLPINRGLGFAYIVPYNKSKKVGNSWIKEKHPQFQIGYKGYKQLAMRTGYYVALNEGIIYEGEQVHQNKLTGKTIITGEPISDTELGYFAYFQLMNGFEKTVYMTKEEIIKHAEKYSESYKAMINAKTDKKPRYPYKPDNYVWDVNFSEMAIKTVIIRLLSKHGVMSAEMKDVMMTDVDNQVERTISLSANKTPLPPIDPFSLPENVDMETGEVLENIEPPKPKQETAPF